MSSNQDFVLKSNKIQTQPVPSRTGAGSLNGFRADVSKIFPVGTSFWKDIGAGTNEIFTTDTLPGNLDLKFMRVKYMGGRG